MFKHLGLLIASLTFLLAPAAHAADIGIVFMHGKSGSPGAGNVLSLASELEFDGYAVVRPEMGWSRQRMYDASFEQSMNEIDKAVQALRQQGVKKVIVVGHSMGANAALGYAATYSNADGIIALAPGHTPELANSRNSAAASVSRAKELIAAGQGKEPTQFDDSNQGKKSAVTATPEVYLSWFDPDGPAVMPKSAAAFKKPTPLLVIVGSKESYGRGPDYILDKAPAHPLSKYATVDAGHNDVPAASGETILAWLKTLN
jgi:pimeloyl-ACP methyl ester carboxylesterase